MPKGMKWFPEEKISLVDTVARHIPICKNEWERIEAEHQFSFPEQDRDLVAIKRNFRNIAGLHPPTGEPNVPRHVAKALATLRAIEEKGRGSDGNSANWSDSLSDSSVGGDPTSNKNMPHNLIPAELNVGDTEGEPEEVQEVEEPVPPPVAESANDAAQDVAAEEPSLFSNGDLFGDGDPAELPLPPPIAPILPPRELFDGRPGVAAALPPQAPPPPAAASAVRRTTTYESSSSDGPLEVGDRVKRLSASYQRKKASGKLTTKRKQKTASSKASAKPAAKQKAAGRKSPPELLTAAISGTANVAAANSAANQKPAARKKPTELRNAATSAATANAATSKTATKTATKTSQSKSKTTKRAAAAPTRPVKGPSKKKSGSSRKASRADDSETEESHFFRPARTKSRALTTPIRRPRSNSEDDDYDDIFGKDPSPRTENSLMLDNSMTQFLMMQSERDDKQREREMEARREDRRIQLEENRRSREENRESRNQMQMFMFALIGGRLGGSPPQLETEADVVRHDDDERKPRAKSDDENEGSSV